MAACSVRSMVTDRMFPQVFVRVWFVEGIAVVRVW
jgi:hypothetical protein